MFIYDEDDDWSDDDDDDWDDDDDDWDDEQQMSFCFIVSLFHHCNQ